MEVDLVKFILIRITLHDDYPQKIHKKYKHNIEEMNKNFDICSRYW